MGREEFINEKEPTIHGDSKWYREHLASRMSHAYMKIDGSYDWPNSEEGDLLRIARQMLVVMDQEESAIELPVPVEQINIHRLLEEVNFEKRIPDFNERQVAFGIVRDVFAQILIKSLKEDS